MNTSEQTDAIAPQWVKALHTVGNVTKDSSGHHGKYATLNACLAAVKPVLEANDLAVQQYSRVGADGRVVVVTRIWHKSGQWIEDEGLAMAAPNDPQKVGGAVSYCRRYSLTTFFAIATEDDDGQSASDTMRAEADKMAELSDRARTVFAELKALDDGAKAAVKDWAGDRKLTVDAMRADEAWMTHVENWLDELKASK